MLSCWGAKHEWQFKRNESSRRFKRNETAIINGVLEVTDYDSAGVFANKIVNREYR